MTGNLGYFAKRRSTANRKAQSERMKKFWAVKRKAKA